MDQPDLIWAKKAVSDLREIHDYIARDSLRYAQAQIQRIQKTAERPRRFPLCGRIVPEFPEEFWRELSCGSYRVIYRFVEESNEIRILAVIHGRRLLDKSLIG